MMMKTENLNWPYRVGDEVCDADDRRGVITESDGDSLTVTIEWDDGTVDAEADPRSYARC